MPAAMGAARVPRTSFKTAYTTKKTITMSAILRGSASLLRYSVYGRISSISCFQVLDSGFAILQGQFDFTVSVNRNPYCSGHVLRHNVLFRTITRTHCL